MINNLKWRCSLKVFWSQKPSGIFRLSTTKERTKYCQVECKTRLCTTKKTSSSCRSFLKTVNELIFWEAAVTFGFLSIAYVLSVNSILGVFFFRRAEENDKYMICLLTLTFKYIRKSSVPFKTSAGSILWLPPGNKQELWHLDGEKKVTFLLRLSFNKETNWCPCFTSFSRS